MKKYKLFEESHKTWQALQVLEEVAKVLPDDLAERCSVSQYMNGREEGFTVTVRTKAKQPKDTEKMYSHATFSEFRRSDDIVLYTGGNYDPGFGDRTTSPDRGTLAEKEYENKRFFEGSPKGYKEVATVIVEFLSKQ